LHRVVLRADGAEPDAAAHLRRQLHARLRVRSIATYRLQGRLRPDSGPRYSKA
jgi:hypothetical protein